MTPAQDSFVHIARYYDPIMAHINYGRWAMICRAVASLLPKGFIHLDAACGTCRLVRKLVGAGWRSFGIDLSFAMLEMARKGERPPSVAAADLRAIPVAGVDFITCLFDSMNFLLEVEDFRSAFRGMADGLNEGGVAYFDVVTERMVLEHFAGQEWTEDNGEFSTQWASRYFPKTSVTETRISVSTGYECTLLERVYALDVIEQAVRDAGLKLLGMFDARTWKGPSKRTVRLDFVAAKHPTRELTRAFQRVSKEVQEKLK